MVIAALPDADFLNLSEIEQVQSCRWQEQSSYVSEFSTFYQNFPEFPELGGDIAELSDLPFTDKEMLRKDQRANKPFGSYLASDPQHVMRLHRTSGTTGTAMNLALSAKDAAMTEHVGARAQRAAGLGPGHMVVHCLNYQLWMGGYTDHATLELTGATVVPFGVGDTVKLLRTIRELGVTAISCTPSYPAVLERVIAEELPDLLPSDLGLKLGLFGGEAGLDDPAYRNRLETTWGFKARNANYGVSDVLCNFASQTDQSHDLHFVALDVLYPELIDPSTERLLPWKEGESGELVLTHLAKECQPLVRFKTGDIITLTGLGQAACKRTAPRFRVTGRSDDMVTVRGLNVFPSMIAAVLNQFSALSSEYRIVLEGSPPYDNLPVEVELLSGTAREKEDLARRIETQIKHATGASARVKLLEPYSLPRTEGKTRRVIRQESSHV